MLGCAPAPREGAIPRTPLPWAALGLDLVTLRVFKAAVEERSLARAADRERLALSALSRRIAEMEARLGTALLRLAFGRPMTWQKAVGYGKRSLGETAVFRYKGIIGRRLRARTLPSITVAFFASDASFVQRLGVRVARATMR